MKGVERAMLRATRLLPILASPSRQGGWPEYWLNCPRRGRVLLETCIDCAALTGIVETPSEDYEFALRCRPALTARRCEQTAQRKSPGHRTSNL